MGVKDYFKTKAEDDYEYSGASESWYRVRIGDYLYKVTCDHAWYSDEEDEDGVDGHYGAEVEYVDFEKSVITPAMKGTVELLWEIFGGTVNSKGYKVLDSHIGAIYGDGITYERACAIYKGLEEKGFAVNNCTLGIGSYTYLGRVSRDTLGFALKATNSVVNGEERLIDKDPITDKIKGNNFKKSQKGMCYVYKDGEDILYTDGHTMEELNEDKFSDNLLEVVFKDAKLIKDASLSVIRNRLHNGKF